MVIKIDPQLIAVSPKKHLNEDRHPSVLTSNSSKPMAKPNRELAWEIAPNLWISFKYAWTGISYAFITQRNFRIHLFIGILAIALSVLLGLEPVEMAAIAITIGMVLAFELLNTALESVVDLTVKQSYHELAKIAKDCAAGAVLVSAFAAILVAAMLLLPPLTAVIQSSLR